MLAKILIIIYIIPKLIANKAFDLKFALFMAI